MASRLILQEGASSGVENSIDRPMRITRIARYAGGLAPVRRVALATPEGFASTRGGGGVSTGRLHSL